MTASSGPPGQALGSCLDDGVSHPEGAPTGRDLHVAVAVDLGDLGQDAGLCVRVPLRLLVDGQLIERSPSPPYQDERIRLHLPATLPPGAVLRLRGQGEPCPGGRAGDLYLQLTRAQPRRSRLWLVALGLVSLLAGVGAGLLWTGC